MASYDDKKAHVNARNRKNREDLRDLGEIPPVQDWARRESCEHDLAKFLKTYMPESFPCPFSQKHLAAIARIQNALIKGGRMLTILPRGFGKSTICVGAAVWAILYGYRTFVPIITASDESAKDRIGTIKTLFESSEFLYQDFPEVCYPARSLEGIPQRAGGLRYREKPTKMSWRIFKIVLPIIPELDESRRQCRASGAAITACGITSRRIRGLQHYLPNGKMVRPDFALLDDPQDDECVKNPTRVVKLMDIFNKSIMGLSGHDKSMSVAIACNILAKDDMIERLLDPNSFNGFEGERVPLIEKFPDALDTLWEEYRRILNDYNKQVVGDVEKALARATEFYINNREAMDAGAVMTWAEMHDDRSVSGIQYAMNKYFTTPEEAFASEYQNQPLDDSQDELQLTAEAVLAKVLRATKQGAVPQNMEKLTCFIDVQKKCLFWLVAAWGGGFSGHVVEYGTFPKQKRRYYTIRDLTGTLARTFPRCQGNQEALWRAGLETLTEELLEREFVREDGSVMRIERLLVDSNDGNATVVVKEFCRQSRHPTIVMPYKSKGVKAENRPFDEYTRKPGDDIGLNWRRAAVKGRNEIRHILADVNYWKSFVRSRWQTAMAAPGSLTLFSGDKEEHRLFCEHMTSEYSVITEGYGRKVDSWSVRPNNTENHWWDCLVGCAVAASFQGIKMTEMEGAPSTRKRIRLSELQSARRAGRVALV